MGEFLEAEGETAAEAALLTDATGVGLAMDRARSRRGGKRTDAAADRFLAAQEALIAKQGHHLDAQFRILGLDHWSKRLRLALQVLAILAATLALSAVGWMAFEAAHADGLVVEAFAVPPLGEPWSRAVTGLEHPVTGRPRPITFDHDAAAERDDVVLAHLGHPLVTLATLGLASFLLSLHQTAVNQPYAFFGTPSRVWEMMQSVA